MADNQHYYGFRYIGCRGGTTVPNFETKPIASHYQPVDGSAANVNLNPGDPLKSIASGAVELAQAGDAVSFIFVGMKQMLHSDGVRPSKTYVGATAYAASSGLFVPKTKRSIAVVQPVVPGMLFEIDADDQSVTTEIGHIANHEANFDHVLSRDTTDSSNPKANPLLDIGTLSTSEGQWRFVRISGTQANRDFTGAYVKLVVQVNESTLVPLGAGV